MKICFAFLLLVDHCDLVILKVVSKKVRLPPVRHDVPSAIVFFFKKRKNTESYLVIVLDRITASQVLHLC